MTAARTGRKQPSIRTLWAIAKSPELHLTDEDLHAVVYRETGKESMKMLTQGEVNTVARVLQNMKDSVSRSVRDKRTDTGGDIRTTAQRRKIYALCEALGWNDDPRRIQGFVKRVAHVDRIEWLNMAQCEKVIEGLKALKEPCAVELYSDSQYIVNALNNGWLRDWKKRGWKRRDGELKNAEMWQELDGLLQKHRVTAVWVRGHADNEWNNRCDALAVEQRDRYAK